MNRPVLLLAAAAALSQDARQIVDEAQHRNRTDSQRYEGVLQVIDAKRKISEKRWQYDRVGAYGNSKAVLRFTDPPLVRGVALLVVNHPDRASDQWMWTPELQRDRRIALQDRSTRFFGTDFTFEDLEERDADQSDYKLLGEETLDGQACWKIESRPKQARNSQYSRVTLWIRKDNYVYVRLDLYVREELVKRCLYRNIQKVQNVWTPLELEMADLRKSSRTVMKMDKLEFNLPLKEENFTLQALRRGL